MSLLKLILHLFLTKVGIQAIKTFKPVADDLDNMKAYGPHQYQPANLAQKLKDHKKITVKLLIATLTLIVISVLYGRYFLTDTADRFI